MISDRRGEAGFLEAMVATAAVCLVMTAFVCYMAAEGPDDDRVEVDRSVADGVSIVGGGYSGDGVEERLAEAVDRGGYSGAALRCRAEGATGIAEGSWSYGTLSGDGVVGETFIRQVRSDDGRVVPTLFEVTVCVRWDGRGSPRSWTPCSS